MIDTTLALDDRLRFRKNLLQRISKLIKTTETIDKIRDKRLQYDINRETAKISSSSSSSSSSSKINKYEYLTGE